MKRLMDYWTMKELSKLEIGSEVGYGELLRHLGEWGDVEDILCTLNLLVEEDYISITNLRYRSHGFLHFYIKKIKNIPTDDFRSLNKT
ncbi:MAG: hypothetical protein HYT62_01575 [Candidatus Yanofskybacteria bacterium]|nr:hypothetical protein [Candidatus Yanofskybacteria bacterium]